VQNQTDKVKPDHTVQARGQVVKELFQVTMGGDGFRNFEESPILMTEDFCLLGLYCLIVHAFTLYLNYGLSSRSSKARVPKKTQGMHEKVGIVWWAGGSLKIAAGVIDNAGSIH
jgi:hypothetical protein